MSMIENAQVRGHSEVRQGSDRVTSNNSQINGVTDITGSNRQHSLDSINFADIISHKQCSMNGYIWVYLLIVTSNPVVAF